MIDGIGSDIKKEGMVESAYPGTPLAAVLSLFEGARRRVGPASGEIHCPTLLLSSREDHVVDPVVRRRPGAIECGGPVERVYLENSYHVATLDWDAAPDRGSGGRVRRQVLGGPGAPAG